MVDTQERTLTDDDELGEAYTGSGEGRPHFVTGVYLVTCVDVKDGGKSRYAKLDNDKQPILDSDGKPIYPEQWKWVFRVDEVDTRRPSKEQLGCVGLQLFRWTNKGLGMGPAGPSNTRAYTEALMGRKLEDGERPKMGAIRGAQAIATIDADEDGRVKKFSLLPVNPADDVSPVPF